MNNANLDQSLTDLNKIIKDHADAAARPVTQEITQFIEFRAKDGGSNNGKGIIWTGEGTAKQLIFKANASRIYSTEHFELDKDKSFAIGGMKVLDGKELGPTVVKSHLQQVGRLKGLIVDGHLNVDQYLFYNGKTSRGKVNSLETWNKSEERLLKKANALWPEVKSLKYKSGAGLE